MALLNSSGGKEDQRYSPNEWRRMIISSNDPWYSEKKATFPLVGLSKSVRPSIYWHCNSMQIKVAQNRFSV